MDVFIIADSILHLVLLVKLHLLYDIIEFLNLAVLLRGGFLPLVNLFTQLVEPLTAFRLIIISFLLQSF